MIIEKKVWPEYFQAILDGKKKFELRIADFECNVGDTLLLREWDPEIKDYTGREIKKEVTYVIKTKDINLFSAEDIAKHGYQVISFN